MEFYSWCLEKVLSVHCSDGGVGWVRGRSEAQMVISKRKRILWPFVFSDLIIDLAYQNVASFSPSPFIFICNDCVYFAGQAMEDLRERYFGPSLEFKSHDKVSDTLVVA